ncbi:MAG: hypothetical protein SFY66_20755 [Oculatellaceae cyanobacterium bins.114]|nr:hypothetical protein [Oculatellaceae cyanobacterium bins.114]
MNQPKKNGRCAYCAETRPLTNDHIPPRNLFPQPRSSNLITVPCCETCQAGWSKDDEYFRAAILSSAKVSETPLAQGAIDSLVRSVSRQKQRGFSRTILKSIKEVEIVTKTGIFLGKEPAFQLDIERIDRVAQRIIRGLFFHEKGYAVPAGYEVFTSIQQFGLEPILEQLTEVHFPQLHIVQDGIFSYTFKETEEDPNSIIWLLLFYKELPLVGFTRLPLSQRNVL